jgi:cytosine deaminase
MSEYDDHYFMHKAVELARKSFGEHGIPVGAVLAVPGLQRELAKGHNMRNQKKDMTRHGEISCLADYGLRPIPNEATLYTTLNPCKMCAGSIRQFNIKRVVVGQEKVQEPIEAFFVGEAAQLAREGIEVVILHDKNCAELFAEFLATDWGLEAWLGDIGEDAPPLANRLP